MNKSSLKRGFTLIEVLVVIGIIAILASIVIIAINPQRQFKQANDTQRWSNVNAILNAVHQYAVDNRGQLPGTIPTTSTIAVCSATSTCSGLVNLASFLAPTYIVSMPVDPTCAVANSTCYTITATSSRLTVSAPNVEVSSVPITVSR
jgi:prepilin-type N-terminal cleavage/methylation domain-containing protein